MKAKVLHILLLAILLMVIVVFPVMAQASGPDPVVRQFDVVGMLAKAAGLIPLVMILVSAIRKMGLKGVALTVSSFVVGTALGILSEYSAAPFYTFTDWFVSSIYGLVIGAAACGAYDLGERWTGAKARGELIVSPVLEVQSNPGNPEAQG